MSAHARRLMRMISARANDIEEWRLGDAALAAAKGYPRLFDAPIIDDWGIVFLDLTLSAETGRLACHEVNGPNAVGSDALTGDSASRATGEAHQAARRVREMGYLDPDGRLTRPVVTVHAHQHGAFFRTGGEFFPRVSQFADALASRLPGNSLVMRPPHEPLADDALSLISGDVPGVAARLAIDPASGRLTYGERPVIFAGNPNLIPEMIRLGALPPGYAAGLPPALRVFHAWRLTPIVHDKALQQDLLNGTGIAPLHTVEAHSREDALAKARAALRDGPIVLKPNGASGGTGVHVVVPGMSDDAIRGRIDRLIADCTAKYGACIERMIYPLRSFRFARSTPYRMDDGDHLWDLRIAVEFEPGKAAAYPASIRLTPRPFDAATFHDDRDQWVSNVSGRRETHLKSGMDDDTLGRIGMTPALMDLALDASVMWTLKAWDHSIRNGGRRDVVHEDAGEARDPEFYPVRKFSV